MPTSASEWPTSPRSKGIATPQSVTPSPGPKACTSKPLPVRMSMASPMRARARSKIRRRRDLEVVLVANDQLDVKPGGARHGRVVERVAAAAAMCGQDIGEAEALRRLRPPEAVAWGGRHGEPVRLAPERVDDRQRGQHGRVCVERIEDRRDERGGQERARGIVDEHPVGCRRRQRFQAGEDRVGAAGPAIDRRQQPGILEAVEGSDAERAILGVDHDLEHVYAGMREYGRDSAPQHGAFAERQILLGHLPSEPLATSGRHDQARRPHQNPVSDIAGRY